MNRQRTIPATTFHTIDNERCPQDTNSWLQDQERDQFDYDDARPNVNPSTTSPIAVRIRPRRLSGHLFGSHTISPGECNKFDASTQGHVATAVRISQYRPQAINVTSSHIDIEPLKRQRCGTAHVQPVNAVELDHKSPQHHHDTGAYDRPDSASSWISQSTFSDDGSFSSFESAISVSTSVSDHEIVKGFTPGGPPSMYRSQSNLSNLSRTGPGIRKNSLPPRAPSRDSNFTMSATDADDECSIEDNYEDDDSNYDSECRSNCSGLTMVSIKDIHHRSHNETLTVKSSSLRGVQQSLRRLLIVCTHSRPERHGTICSPLSSPSLSKKVCLKTVVTNAKSISQLLEEPSLIFCTAIATLMPGYSSIGNYVLGARCVSRIYASVLSVYMTCIITATITYYSLYRLWEWTPHRPLLLKN